MRPNKPDVQREGEPTASTTTGPVGFVHISDLHMRGTVPWDQDVVRKNFLKNLPGLLDESGVVPHLVFATGDFADRGDVEGFHRAHAFLQALMDICADRVPQSERLRQDGTLGVDMREWAAPRLFLAPGNHDVRRAGISRLHKHTQTALWALRDDAEAFRKELGDWWDDGTFVDLAGSRLRDYYAFTGMVLGDARQTASDRGYRVDSVTVRGLRIGVLSLNSAWMCSEDDDKQHAVPIGERHIRDALRDLNALGAQYTFALIHHPPSWWAPAERRTIDELLRESCNVVLHGHVHDDEWIQSHGPGGELIALTAGALYSGSGNRHAFQLGSIDVAAGVLRVHAMTYAARGAGRWHRDASLPGGTSDGTFDFRLALPANPATAAPAPAALLDRLARTAAQVYGSVDFMGLPSEIGRPQQARLETLYVPQRFVREGGNELTFDALREALLTRDGHVDPGGRALANRIHLWREAAMREPKDLEVLAEVLHRLVGRPAPALVVLGEPGSGKTLLIKALAWHVSRAKAPLFPMVVTLREWIADGGRIGLLEYAANRLASLLSEPISTQTLHELAERGDAVLLVDGFDEVVASDQRAFVRDTVVGLAAKFERLPIVCTSRVTGYRDAPLPDSFAELTLAPLSDPELDDFAHRWFANQFPGDPRERESKRSQFVSALHAEPRAKELARNPLLATLIAMVHVGEGVLPSERAWLYELLVRLLVETWPRTTKRTFHDDARLTFGRQRKLLEAIAFEMQMGRGKDERTSATAKRDHSADVLIGRAELETIATREIAREVQEDESTAKGIAHRWIEFVASGLGVLVERRAGQFGFLHLSLLEYLAGQEARRRWGAQGQDALASQMIEAATSAHHVEMVLLMLGDRNTPRELADNVVRGVPNPEFGLRALRDDVDMSRGVVEMAVDRAIGRAMDRATGRIVMTSAAAISERMDQVVRFSRRHAGAIRELLEPRILGGDAMRFAVAYHVAGRSLRQIAKQRGDWLSTLSSSGTDVHEVAAHWYLTWADQRERGIRLVAQLWTLVGMRLGAFEAFWGPSFAPLIAAAVPCSLHRMAPGNGASDRNASGWYRQHKLSASISLTKLDMALQSYSGGIESRGPLAAMNFSVAAVTIPSGTRFGLEQFANHALVSAGTFLGDGAVYRSDAFRLWGLADRVVSDVLKEATPNSAGSLLGLSARKVVADYRNALASLSPPRPPVDELDAHYIGYFREAVSPLLRPLVEVVYTHCILAGLSATHEGKLDHDIFALEIGKRLTALWACWAHEGIAAYVLKNESDVPAARAKIAAYAVMSRSLAFEWPASAWLDAWRAAGEPQSWDERYVWWLCEAFDNPEDPAPITKARDVLAETMLRGRDEDEREVAEWLRNIDLHPMTRAEAEEEARKGAALWAEEIAKYGDAGWGWLLGDRPFPDAS